MKNPKEWMLASIVLLTIAVAGCGGNDISTKRVKGTITFKGGQPPKEGGVLFTPIERTAELPMREARGNMNADGTFTLTTFKEGDGVLPGKYRVKITCWREAPTLATSVTANYVPPDFIPEVVIGVDDAEPVAVVIDVPILQGK